MVFQQDNNNGDEEESKWEASAIGRVTIEGRMNYQTVEKYFKFTCPLMAAEDLKIV